MKRPSLTIACLVIFAGISDLRSQDARDLIFAAHRTGVAEVIDPASFKTVARIHFDFHIERLSPSADGSALYVNGYGEDPCCEQYTLNLSTLKLKKTEPIGASWSPPSEYYGNPQFSPDGRWRIELRSFRGPALKMFNRDTRAAEELVPSPLPMTEDNCGGNWYAQGVWSGDRFYFYVTCPNHPGFLWAVSPGATQLEKRIPIAAFGEVPDCRNPLPVGKALVAAAGKLLLYELFGGKSDRTGACQTSLPGGAWIVNPATGSLVQQIAAGVHFNQLIANHAGSTLYGVDPGDAGWGGPVQLVALDGQNYQVVKSRTFDPGVLQIAIGPLRQIPTSDVRVASPRIDR